jgi:hypothetical protein
MKPRTVQSPPPPPIIIIIIIIFTFIHVMTQLPEGQLQKQHKHVNYKQYAYDLKREH